jgi:DNA-binding NarL/FixJ family response regulator
MTDLGERRSLAAPSEQEGLAIVLLDEEQALAEALATVLAKYPLVASTCAVSKPKQAMALIDRDDVDVLIVGTDSSSWDPLDLLRSVALWKPDVALVALSADEDPDRVARTLLAGAVSWVSKRTGVDEMAAALVASARGESRVPPAMLRSVLHRLRTMAAVPAQWTLLQNLTVREREVLEYAVLGYSRNDIAGELGLSVNTVRTHLQHILAKLGARSTLEAVSMFLREQGRPATGGHGEQERIGR